MTKTTRLENQESRNAKTSTYRFRGRSKSVLHKPGSKGLGFRVQGLGFRVLHKPGSK